MPAYLAAGALSGAAGLLIFLIIHHFWIRPIWFILPIGLVIAMIGGLAVGWSYQELKGHLPGGIWIVPSWIALIAVILLPAVVLAEVREPMFDFSAPTAVLRVSTSKAVLLFILELLGTASLTGGLAGWLIGGSARAAAITALAGFIFALGPGHNIPFLGSTPAVGKGIILLLAIVTVATIVLVVIESLLSKQWNPF